jgi:hypothetical protein
MIALKIAKYAFEDVKQVIIVISEILLFTGSLGDDMVMLNGNAIYYAHILLGWRDNV